MKGVSIIFVMLTCLPLFGCMTFKTQLLSAELKDNNDRICISSVESDLDGMKNFAVEEQMMAIGNCLFEKSNRQNKEPLTLKMKIFEKSFFIDGNYVHSLFLKCSLYDEDCNEVAVLSEYSTGMETFYSPEVQEKFLRKCLSKIEAMSL
ncbi:hypothetical protein [Treponema sp.]|uniref:hypothetical protein n=1 Tax=Treponema sp. TaxID=166 RepID=UPI00388F747C